MKEFDVIVAGGGSAGCVVASRLSEDADCSVCLVEAGPDYGPYEEGRWPADILDARELAFSHSWERSDPDDRSQLRARILGGCSSHNACAVLPGAAADYDEWGPGWTADELRPYLERAAATIRTRRFTPEELAPTSFAVLLGVDEELDLEVLDDASEDRPGAGPFPVNALGAVRWNAAFAYVDPARNRPNFTMLADTLVDRVEPGKAFARRGGEELELRARTIVVTAGAYGSPAILLRSGIDNLPVGENLVDHPGTGAGWTATDGLQAVSAYAREHPIFMAQVVVKACSRHCEEGLWDIHLFPATEPGKDELGHPSGTYELSAAVFALKPRSRGRVRLGGPDPETPPVIEHGFLSDPSDVDVLVDGLELLRELAETAAMDAYVGEELRPGPGVDLEAYVRETVRGYFHPVGTCALGTVVDVNGAVIGHENLFVADASLMPTIPRANTNLSTLAVAEKIAASLGAA